MMLLNSITRRLATTVTVLMTALGSPVSSSQAVEPVILPYMEREASHREYLDRLLKLALTLSEEKFGPYELVQPARETVIRRQLLELIKGENLSVAVSMPMPEWLNNARRVPFPLLKGLASFRVFVADKQWLSRNDIDSLEALKTHRIGQGRGWSTASLLEANGFNVVYGGPYETLLPMLKAGRFDLLMRGVYEAGPELEGARKTVPGLGIATEFEVFTYLPTYYFVSKDRPILAERIEYGLIKAHQSGAMEQLFQEHFGHLVKELDRSQRPMFYVPNTNIDDSFYEQDRRYLLDAVNRVMERYSGAAPSSPEAEQDSP